MVTGCEKELHHLLPSYDVTDVYNHPRKDLTLSTLTAVELPLQMMRWKSWLSHPLYRPRNYSSSSSFVVILLSLIGLIALLSQDWTVQLQLLRSSTSNTVVSVSSQIRLIPEEEYHQVRNILSVSKN
jgi:hypothetical protein